MPDKAPIEQPGYGVITDPDRAARVMIDGLGIWLRQHAHDQSMTVGQIMMHVSQHISAIAGEHGVMLPGLRI